jgi:hypothetical protein
VAGEVVELAERYRVGELWFQDEDFFADPARVEGIASGLIDAGAPLAWRAEVRPEDVLESGPGALQRLAQSGCLGLPSSFGWWSGAVARRCRLAPRLGRRFVFEVAEGGSAATSRPRCRWRVRLRDSRFVTRSGGDASP